MSPTIEVVSGREHAKLETKGELIATYLGPSTDLIILLTDKAISNQKLAFFKSDVKDLRNRKRGTVTVKLNSDKAGLVVLNSLVIKNEALNVRENAYIGINKPYRE